MRRPGEAADAQGKLDQGKDPISSASASIFQQYVDDALSLREEWARAIERGDNQHAQICRQLLDRLLNGDLAR
jgi:hypothetical protein